MTSEGGYREAYVWIFPPDATEPVVAGRLNRAGDQLLFNYGRSYLERKNAIAIYDPELPLKPGVLPLSSGLDMPSCIRDAAPDAWGRRVLVNMKLGLKGRDADGIRLDELTYLLGSRRRTRFPTLSDGIRAAPCCRGHAGGAPTICCAG